LNRADVDTFADLYATAGTKSPMWFEPCLEVLRKSLRTDKSGMTGCVAVSTIFEIGSCFRLDPESGVLLHDGKPTSLGPRAIALLRALVGRAGQYVSKSDLLDAGWPHDQVTEGNVAVQVLAIRRTLAQGGGDTWIETLPRRGYRFLGPVKKLTTHRTDPSDDGGSSLPPAQSSFVGRERELIEIKRLLPSRRLLTILGFGGVGKTRLALQVATEVVDAYRDGVWMADLVPLRESSLVSATVGQLLGVAERPGKSSTEALCAYLKSRQVLLILDNCEHLVDACARLAEAILRNTKDVTIMATSREPLRLSDEQSYVLQPLSLPNVSSPETTLKSEAVELFVDRVRQHLPGFELTPEREGAVAGICIHLDGIPLALELAAARARSLSVEQINTRLSDRFRLLTTGPRTALPRQQTLRAVLDWSYDLLAEDERVVLRRISIFPGSFTVEAASAVASDDRIDAYAVTDLMSLLGSRSLVIADASTGETRYRLLETTCAYAQEKLAETGEGAAIGRRHAHFFRDFFEPALDDRLSKTAIVWRAKYVPELDNVRVALDRAFDTGDSAIGVALAGGSGELWGMLGLFGEGVRRLENAIDRIDDQTPASEQARLWLWFGRLVDETPAQACRAFERAAELYERLGDRMGRGHALVRLGRVLAFMGRSQEAERALGNAYPLLKDLAPPRVLSLYFAHRAFFATFTGDLAAARVNYEQSLELDRQAGDEFGVLAIIGNLANVTWALGDLDAASAATREQIALLRRSRVSTRRLLGYALSNLAGILTERGDLSEALSAAKEGLPLVKADGSGWIFGDHVALRAALAGRLREAARVAGYSDAAWAAKKASRQPNEARARDRLHSLLREKVSTDDLARFLAEGAKMSEDEAWRLALEG
jgi:predicted ATPase/DNA-binding winged helix-turn-helix (wHTH) protein